MRFFDLFRRIPDVAEVSFPIPYHWAEHWRTLAFDIREFRDAKMFHQPLAMMSFGFALSTFTAMDLKQGGEANAVSFLKQAHFSDIVAAEDYAHQATSESLGFVFGQRKIKRNGKKLTLIAVGIRGGHYGAEWASNAKLGSEGPHQGFYEASERTYSEFLLYIASKRIKGDIAVWAVGYSRAGGVAALFVDKLSRGMVEGGPHKHFHNTTLELDNIFAYTFASPKSGEWNGDEYSFIHNIINPDDLIPRIPFASFGFGHYGYEHKLTISPEKEMLLQKELAKDGLEFDIPVFTAMTIDFRHIFDAKRRFTEDFARPGGQGGFLDDVVALISSRITRAAYAKYIQNGLAALASLVDEMSPAPYEKLAAFMKTIFDGVMEDYGILSLLGKINSEKTQWKSILEPYVERALEAEPELEDSKEDILNAVAGFMHFLAPSLRDLYSLYPTLRDKENAKAIAFAHEPVRYYMLLLANGMIS